MFQSPASPGTPALLSGNEAIALAARAAGVALGAGYPGTPSTEILECFAELGGKAQWAPNEKVALEVGIGAAYAGARALVTMKHVGLNVAADPLFTVAYTGVSGALVIVSADDPGMASSQNEQDNRWYALAAGVPMLEPSDSQEAYDYTLHAIEISERWGLPVLLRTTTRVCHSKTVVRPQPCYLPAPQPSFVRDISSRVMIPGYARMAHRRLRERLKAIAAWNEAEGPTLRIEGERSLGILATGIAFQHAREAAPGASFLKPGMTHPLPMETIRSFASTVNRFVIIEEGDDYLAQAVRAAGIPAESKPDIYRFGELNVTRVRRILAAAREPEPTPPPGTPPSLCQGCPHRVVFQALRELDCIVAGDIGCYSLGALSPFEAMDALVCMGASVGMGLGLRHVLAPDQARRVVSVIGDSTFVHSGITGMIEMIYNPPPSGHVLIILDNGTTAMTGFQEHPGTGRTLDHRPTGIVRYEDIARALGIARVHTVDPASLKVEGFCRLVRDCLDSGQLCLIIARRDCLLASARIRQNQRQAEGNVPGSGY